MINPGDTVLITDPGYPGYLSIIWFAGGEHFAVPISAENILKIYERRRKLVVDTLNNMGWNYTLPKGTFYLWVPTPEGISSIECADQLFEKTHVVVAPGSAYGKFGEGFIRL